MKLLKNIPCSRSAQVFVCASLFVGGSAFAQTTFNNGVADGDLLNGGNWDSGLPTTSSLGTVTNFATTYTTNAFRGKMYSFNGTTSVTQTSNGFNFIDQGGSAVLNNSSSITTLGDIWVGFDGAGSWEMNDTSSADVTGGLRMQGASAAFSMYDQSSIVMTSNFVAYDQAQTLTLNDSASISTTIGFATGSSGSFIFNFVQASTSFAPTISIGAGQSFDQTYIQYQINGVDVDLTDARFVLTDNAVGFDTLTLTTVPEPASFALLGGLLALTAVAVRRRK